MYHKTFEQRKYVRLVRQALTVGLALALVSAGSIHTAQAAAGELDPTFGNGGKAETEISHDY
jgi:hypothetical protein